MKTDKVIEHIVSWLKTYSIQSKTNGFVVGISGGIDSALTSTLCAMTGRPTWLLNMPILQAPSQLTRAEQHIGWLQNRFEQVQSEKVDLTPVFQSIQSTYPKEIQDDLSMANTRARLRMTTLYTYAGHHKLLVAGTGNKVEDFGVGFFTKYGDGGVDLSPIADLYKSEVYTLAKALDINSAILEAAPTDGLYGDDLTDEMQIGATYPELEWAMEYLRTQSTASLSEREEEVLRIYRSRHSANQHKMVPIPVCDIPKSLWK